MKTLLVASTCALLCVSVPARAAVVISSGQFGGLGVHSTPGLLHLGTVTGHAGTGLVTISTDADDTLDTSGGGESEYDADSGAMDDLSILFARNYGAVTFNLKIPHGGTTDFALSVNGGAFTFTETGLAQGENKFKLNASGGDFIHSLDFTFTGSGVADIRQIRVGEVVGGAIPEPATWGLMLLGFGGLGAMLRRRRTVVA